MYRFAVLVVLAPTLMAVDCDPAPSTPDQPELFPCDSLFDMEAPGHPILVNVYAWNGADHIVVDKGCCDQFIDVYEVATCDYVCAPEGGITAFGDGRCPTFYDEATFIETAWQE